MICFNAGQSQDGLIALEDATLIDRRIGDRVVLNVCDSFARNYPQNAYVSSFR
jgi:hypothetical protein